MSNVANVGIGIDWDHLFVILEQKFVHTYLLTCLFIDDFKLSNNRFFTSSSNVKNLCFKKLWSCFGLTRNNPANPTYFYNILTPHTPTAIYQTTGVLRANNKEVFVCMRHWNVINLHYK